MKGKYILHIPTGMYYRYAYWPNLNKVCCVVLVKEPYLGWLDYTLHFESLKEAESVFIDERGIVGLYEVSSNEFELIDIEVNT